MRTRYARRLLSGALALIALGLLWFYFAPAGLGGSTTYVVTNGISMEPLFHTGDLALVRSQSSYHVGEIVAYNSRVYHTVVLHRIIGRAGSRYIFKGDNNNFVDFEHPAASQLIGALWLHLPGWGARLRSVDSPALVGGLVAFAVLLFTGVSFARGRRRRRREQRAGGSPGHSPPRAPRRTAGPTGEVLAIGLVALLPFVLLGLLAFTRSSTAPTPLKVPYRQSARLSYSAAATPGPVYPGDRAVTGEPLFTHVVNLVNLSFSYRFHAAAAHSLAGDASLSATLTSTSGWHTTLPLGQPTRFSGDRALVTATLDLPTLLALMHNVNTATGVGGVYTLTLVPHVHVRGSLDGQPLSAFFAPPAQFTVGEGEIQPSVATGDSSTTGQPLANTDQQAANPFASSASGSVAGMRHQPRFLSFGVGRLSVATAREIALAGIALVVCVLMAIMTLMRPRLRDEAASIRARYGRLIVPVARVWQLPGVPVIDVADMDALAQIAEHYDRSILLETTADGEAFWVADESAQFRYAIGTWASPADGVAEGGPLDTPPGEVYVEEYELGEAAIAAYERQPADDPYERRPPRDVYERQPARDMYERQPADDVYGRRPADDMYERQPADDVYGRRPADDPYERQPADDAYRPQSAHHAAAADAAPTEEWSAMRRSGRGRARSPRLV
jgi:signal peptidase I